MRAVALIRHVLTSNARLLERALDGLTDADLIKRPGEETNPLGGLLWPQTRVEDATIAAILAQPQVSVTQDWAHQLGLAADAADLGKGIRWTKSWSFGLASAPCRGIGRRCESARYPA